MFLVYMLRVWMLQGWYIVTYGLGIHILNLFIGFITPQVRVVDNTLFYCLPATMAHSFVKGPASFANVFFLCMGWVALHTC